MSRPITPLHFPGRAALGRALRAAWTRPAAIDLLLALPVAVAVGGAIGIAEGSGTRQPTLLAYAHAACIGVLVLGRRRWPMGVLLASHVTLQAYSFSNFPSSGRRWRSPSPCIASPRRATSGGR
ncbi:hypothetical protein [Kallotenue papyrolyticum]|uniref:hypothetical protein n=1 Tax=Kallotenue papyrolyticum TaxID=1325125 RepID=UPI0004B88747|nr:hypothetical protein [Kallotenue papyrolyticum]